MNKFPFHPDSAGNKIILKSELQAYLIELHAEFVAESIKAESISGQWYAGAISFLESLISKIDDV